MVNGEKCGSILVEKQVEKHATVKPQYSGHLWAMKLTIIRRWPLYRGQNEWGKVLLVDTNVAFIKRWPSYRVTTIVRFHYY